MKRTVAIACVMLAASTLLAQNYYRAVQQAKRDSAQNDAEQKRIQQAANGSASPAASAPAPAPAAPMNPVLQATLANISSLQTDFTALVNTAADKAEPTQRASLMNNLTQAAQSDKKASADSVKKLAVDLSTAISGRKKLAAAQQTKLAQYVHALFNSSHVSPAQQQGLLTNVQKILTDGGASLDEAVNVVTDLKSVVTETQ